MSFEAPAYWLLNYKACLLGLQSCLTARVLRAVGVRRGNVQRLACSLIYQI